MLVTGKPPLVDGPDKLTWCKVKPLSPLRSSDRRKIADQIIADYGIEIPKPEVAEAGSDEQTTPTAVGLGALRNSLLPDNSLSARFTTTAGPNLKQVSGTIYAGAHPGQVQRILWIKIEERLYPTGGWPSHVKTNVYSHSSSQFTRYGTTLA